jgi:hypothetical protein
MSAGVRYNNVGSKAHLGSHHGRFIVKANKQVIIALIINALLILALSCGCGMGWAG